MSHVLNSINMAANIFSSQGAVKIILVHGFRIISCLGVGDPVSGSLRAIKNQFFFVDQAAWVVEHLIPEGILRKALANPQKILSKP